VNFVHISQYLININQVFAIKEWVEEESNVKYTRFFYNPHDFVDVKGHWINYINNHIKEL